MFAYIIDKVKTVTQGWSQRYLSPGGKEVLLKAVALAMPIFSMNVFRLPKEVCEVFRLPMPITLVPMDTSPNQCR